MKELKNRIRENKYLTRNETDFIIKALEENSSLRKQVNMWQSEHAKRVLELGRLIEGIEKGKKELKDDWQLQKYPASPFSCGVRHALETIDKHLGEVDDEQ